MRRVRLIAALALFLVTPAGFACKFYRGPAHVWLNVHGAGVLYEVFWILLAFFFLGSKRTVKLIPAWVFGLTCALEVMQLWHPPALERIRQTFLGAAVLGTTFDWWDFPHYAAGCLLGWLLIRALTAAEAQRTRAAHPDG